MADAPKLKTKDKLSSRRQFPLPTQRSKIPYSQQGEPLAIRLRTLLDFPPTEKKAAQGHSENMSYYFLEVLLRNSCL